MAHTIHALHVQNNMHDKWHNWVGHNTGSTNGVFVYLTNGNLLALFGDTDVINFTLVVILIQYSIFDTRYSLTINGERHVLHIFITFLKMNVNNLFVHN